MRAILKAKYHSEQQLPNMGNFLKTEMILGGKPLHNIGSILVQIRAKFVPHLVVVADRHP